MAPLNASDLLGQWRRAVNATPEALEEWLTTPQSASVGSRPTGALHSVGQLAGLRTVPLLEIPPQEWNEADWAHVRRTVGFVRRHRAQWPRGDLRARRWTHALRNWGHDPLWWGRLTTPRIEDGSQALTVDGAQVGTLALRLSSDAVTVEHLELEPHWRGRGVGSAALHEICRVPDRRVEVDLFGAGTGAADFFQRRGFGVLASSAEHTHLVLPRR